jgi:hypothetical protein
MKLDWLRDFEAVQVEDLLPGMMVLFDDNSNWSICVFNAPDDGGFANEREMQQVIFLVENQVISLCWYRSGYRKVLRTNH